MKSKSVRLVRRNHARYHHGRDDLNIVPMIDMMVILVFFLIFTAVFSKTNILQLNLPANAAAALLPPGLKLEVIVRANDILINNSNPDRGRSPLLDDFPNKAGKYDYDALSTYMRMVKAQFPNMTDASVLLGPDVPYNVLVQVMDAVRVYQLPIAPYSKAALFPDIVIGDAPK
ncbi:MAG TPA: biopolymer transporter ExbD [Steroidobacteraceae bacterium]|nr:biopolymer transporter ExbD [Steroidobacteraceae bacterium]